MVRSPGRFGSLPPRSGSREKTRRARRPACLRSPLGVESLEDRRLLAAFVEGEILVQFAPTAAVSARAAARAALGGRGLEAIQTGAMRARGEGVLERIALPAGLGVERAVAALSRRADVLYAEPNWRIAPAAVADDPTYTAGRLWGMQGDDLPLPSGPAGTTNAFGSQAEKAWDAGFTGSRSVAVGIVDTGIDITHPDLRANIWVNPFDAAGDGIDNDGNGYVDDTHGWDFLNNDRTVYDGAGDEHGTHVAGTIGAVGGDGAGVAGVNWAVTMIPAKFLGPDGGSTSAAIKAIDYLTDLKRRHGVPIVASNNSWGGAGYSAALHAAIIRAADAGILFVASAGNGGADGVGDSNDATPYYPSGYTTIQGTTSQRAAAYESVISVAALTSSGTRAGYSNWGATTVDIAAPGSGIVSTLPGGTWGSSSGTSMAAPHVTGAAALYLAAHPGASPAAIRDAILSTARPTAAVAGLVASGGRLDAAAALGVVPPAPATPPTLAIAGVTASERQGSFVFKVTLSAAATASVTVRFATAEGTAREGRRADYRSTSGTLTFAPGETSKSVAVTVINDTRAEATETFMVRLSGAVNAAIATASATGTILDDDTLAAFATLGGDGWNDAPGGTAGKRRCIRPGGG